VLQEGK